MATPNQNAAAPSPTLNKAKGWGPLDIIERTGNVLPDPALLFAAGALLVLVLSWALAPKLEGGYELRWEAEDRVTIRDQKSKNGGTDEQVAYIARNLRDDQGELVLDDKDKPIEERAAATLATDDDGSPQVRLRSVHSGQELTDETGEPIDLRESGWVVLPKTIPTTQQSVGHAELEEDRPALIPTGEVLIANNLLSSEGLYWTFTSMVKNFTGFAPLGVVLVGMLGIGVAERSGLLAALLKLFASIVPKQFITPAMVFLGVMSSMGLDAGYVVLPPLAAAIYASLGRSPLAGIAAVFAGVSAGFNANLFVTGLDPMLANFTNQAVALVDAEREIAATANWGFMAASTFIMTGLGWFVTAVLVEPRLTKKPSIEGGPGMHASEQQSSITAPFTKQEAQGLVAAIVSFLTVVGLVVALAAIPNSPLHGGGTFPRWVSVIVPILFFAFVLPGVVYGVITGTARGSKPIADMMVDTMKAMAPIIVLAFFAGQFVAYFAESNLGAMIAHAGGQWLYALDMPAALLIVTFIIVVGIFNLFMGSMSAKYALLAPIFVPMFLLVGIRPELTQVAYRIGDSVTNIITPLNAYLVIILVFMRQYAPKAGMGTLIAMMVPYTVVFGIGWTIMLLIWMGAGWPLGPGDVVGLP